MKKTFGYLLAGMTCMALTFNACSDSSEPTGGGGGQYQNTPYSDLTPEQQKEKLADEANAFINQMKGLENQKAVDVMEALDNLLNDSAQLPNVGGNVIGSSQELYKINQFYGKFTWQPATKTWKEEPAQALSFNFPVGSQQAVISITGVSSGKIYSYEEYYDSYWDYEKQQWIDEYETYKVDLPKSLSAEITLNGEKVGSISLNAEIVSANDIPNSANMSLSLGSYTFTQSANKNGSATASLKNGSTTLMSLSAKLNGDLEQLGASDDYTGNFQLKLMDLVFEGNMDYASYAKEEKELYAVYRNANYSDAAWENYVKGEVEVFNKYSNIYLVSTKDNTKIAKLILKAKRTAYYDAWSGQTYYDWESVPVLEFGDGTQVEAEAYFTSGFDTVLDNFKNFIKTFGIEID